MTITKIREKAEEFNREYFDSKIDMSNISFKISNRMTRTWGLCQYLYATKSIEIKLSQIIFLEEWHWNQTLIHELIHALELQQYGNASHGYFFKAWAKSINYNSNGYFQISRTTSATEKVANAVAEKKKSYNKNQYIIQKGNYVNFLRKLAVYELKDAKARGFKVFEVENSIPNVQHSKNYMYAIQFRRCYMSSIIDKYSLKLKEL